MSWSSLPHQPLWPLGPSNPPSGNPGYRPACTHMYECSIPWTFHRSARDQASGAGVQIEQRFSIHMQNILVTWCWRTYLTSMFDIPTYYMLWPLCEKYTVCIPIRDWMLASVCYVVIYMKWLLVSVSNGVFGWRITTKVYLLDCHIASSPRHQHVQLGCLASKAQNR